MDPRLLRSAKAPSRIGISVYAQAKHVTVDVVIAIAAANASASCAALTAVACRPCSCSSTSGSSSSSGSGSARACKTTPTTCPNRKLGLFGMNNNTHYVECTVCEHTNTGRKLIAEGKGVCVLVIKSEFLQFFFAYFFFLFIYLCILRRMSICQKALKPASPPHFPRTQTNTKSVAMHQPQRVTTHSRKQPLEKVCICVRTHAQTLLHVKNALTLLSHV